MFSTDTRETLLKYFVGIPLVADVATGQAHASAPHNVP